MSDDPFSEHARQVHINQAVAQFHCQLAAVKRELGRHGITDAFIEAIRSVYKVADSMLDFADREARVELARSDGPRRNPYSLERESESVELIRRLAEDLGASADQAEAVSPAWRHEMKSHLMNVGRAEAQPVIHKLHLDFGERRVVFEHEFRQRQAAQPDHGSRTTAVRGKHSTARGDARVKIIAALTEHHDFAGGCMNWGAIGVRALARKAGVAAGSVTAFFNQEFGDAEKGNGHARYQVACQDRGLLSKLRQWNEDWVLPEADRDLPDEREYDD